MKVSYIANLRDWTALVPIHSPSHGRFRCYAQYRVRARTRSEARARVKAEWGAGRLPVGTRLGLSP